MTAEVVVMNKSAVAMAADSAVTIGGGRKIYNTVNKLFPLSDGLPVGIMIYGNGEFMDHPWETIVKEYAITVNGNPKETISDYAEDFVRFIERRADIFTPDLQMEYHKSCTTSYLRYLKDKIDRTIKSELEKTDSIESSYVEAVANEIISSNFLELQKCEKLNNYSPAYHDSLIAAQTPWINEEIKKIFQKLPLSSVSHDRLVSMSAMIFYSNFFHGGKSGVVFSGFGSKEIFPSIVALEVEGITEGMVKYSQFMSQTISTKLNGAIIPFAQRDVVDSFIEGFHPNYSGLLMGYLKTLFRSYPEKLLATIPDLDGLDKVSIREKQLGVGDKMLNIFEERLQKFKLEQHVNPIVNAVAFLPKDELAAMAETLVHLTSFKRRMSMERETVGGPVDVAVISKGDGFVWIRKKNYFETGPNSGNHRKG